MSRLVHEQNIAWVSSFPSLEVRSLCDFAFEELPMSPTTCAVPRKDPDQMRKACMILFEDREVTAVTSGEVTRIIAMSTMS